MFIFKKMFIFLFLSTGIVNIYGMDNNKVDFDEFNFVRPRFVESCHKTKLAPVKEEETNDQLNSNITQNTQEATTNNENDLNMLREILTLQISAQIEKDMAKENYRKTVPLAKKILIVANKKRKEQEDKFYSRRSFHHVKSPLSSNSSSSPEPEKNN